MQLLRQTTGKAGIPCVHVDQIGIHVVGDLQVNAEGLQCGIGVLQLGRNVIAHQVKRAFRIGSGNGRNVSGGARPVERAYRHIDTLRQNL